MTILRLAIIVLSSALVFIACESETKDTPPETTGKNVLEPDQIMTDAEIFITRNGIRKGTIKSERLKAFNRQDSTLLYDVEVLFFDEQGEHTSTLVADSATVRKHSNLMSAFGDVEAWTEDDRRLVADSLRWDANKDLIVTEGYVEVYRGGDVLTGYGLEADQRLKSTVIKRDLKGTFSEPEEDAPDENN